MQIGEVARRVGVNPRTIRYYESIGLLPEPARTASGYRDYGPDDIDRIAFARRATELDLRLDEITEILALRDRGERPCNYVLDIARRRVDEIDERIQAMQRAREELARLIDRAPATESDDACYCELIEHRTTDEPEGAS